MTRGGTRRPTDRGVHTVELSSLQQPAVRVGDDNIPASDPLNSVALCGLPIWRRRDGQMVAARVAAVDRAALAALWPR